MKGEGIASSLFNFCLLDWQVLIFCALGLKKPIYAPE